MNHPQDNDLVSSEQHGFVRGWSCVVYLLEVLDSWTEIVDAGGSVVNIYMDFWKAFKTIFH